MSAGSNTPGEIIFFFNIGMDSDVNIETLPILE
jgi:hypothetical protein